jgi:iron complex outermembrane receptor protein
MIVSSPRRFQDTDPDIGDELQALNVGAAQFFTNAIDTKTKGWMSF